jgi:uncharacterized RDD family membrane protein YckC
MIEGRVSPVPREARPYQGQRAGVVTRMAAAVIDAVVVLVILLLGYAAVAGLAFMLDPLSFHFPRLSWLRDFPAALAIDVIYLTVAWAMSGRTYGMLIMGLRVVSHRRRKLRLLAALLRAIVCVLFPIGLLWCAVSAENRSLQDVLLRTSVIYDWQPIGAAGPPGGPRGRRDDKS